jgi:hypothetical protein
MLKRIFCLVLLFSGDKILSQPIFQSNIFSVFPDKIVQDKYEAKALSATHITSNYQSPANLYQSATINFKFSINGRDNEMLSGIDHHLTITANKSSTAVIKFGQQFNKVTEDPQFMQPNTKLTIRVDMREVLRQFSQNGFYSCFNGEKIYKEDFKGVYVAGNTAPLIWDFDNLVNHPELELKDTNGDGIYETTLEFNKFSNQQKADADWKITKDITAYPQYSSGYLLTDAVYNLSLEEMAKAIEKDSTFRTGKEWGGVWTRDVSYSIILAMAYLQPRVAMNSLLRKVNKKKRIIQDTGTGGAYPCSTDRVIWAVAAWELYKVTGDKNWLQESFEIIKNTIDDDLQNIYDEQTGLVKGESSFLDWREQTYPKWMQPADIFESECLGTNAVHYKANKVLAEMAGALKDYAAEKKYNAIANKIREGINTCLWMPEKHYYGQFLYGRNYKILSHRSEALGEALCILFGIADKKRGEEIIANTPVTDFGITCIFPQIPGIPPYHNNAIWPFVQAYWMLAAAKVGNSEAVTESIADIYRSAALFLTNKENMVASNGDYNGTQINSSVMLWSLSGNISIVHKVMFGLDFEKDRLCFSPYVPKSLTGKRILKNFKYRDAILNIELDGYGNKIAVFMIDGNIISNAAIPSNLKGTHTIKIFLKEAGNQVYSINKIKNHTSAVTPLIEYKNNRLTWDVVPGAKFYKIIRNGQRYKNQIGVTLTIDSSKFYEYSVIAVDSSGFESFASEPFVVKKYNEMQNIQLEGTNTPAAYDYKDFSGKGFVETSINVNKLLQAPLFIKKQGVYAIKFRYANGNGPANTDNKCAVRTLVVDDKKVGTVVLPQRGKGEWSNWGYSNSLQVNLQAGIHHLVVYLNDYNDNMNGIVNQAMLDYIQVVRVK